MKILGISDIHENFEKAQRLIERFAVGVDLIVLLGDYFDSFYYNENHKSHFMNHLLWLKSIVDNDKIVPLIGNHDVHYFTNNSCYVCSGFSPWKISLIDTILGRDFWKNMEFLKFCRGKYNNFLFTHAGLHPDFLHPYFQINTSTFDDLNQRIKYNFNINHVDPYLSAGRSRGGPNRLGGITWLDWSEFESIDGLVQIVGHTCREDVRTINGNYCLDTGLNHVAIIDTDSENPVIIKESWDV